MKPDNDLAVVGLLLSAGVCELVSELLCEFGQAHLPVGRRWPRRSQSLILHDLTERLLIQLQRRCPVIRRALHQKGALLGAWKPR